MEGLQQVLAQALAKAGRFHSRRRVNEYIDAQSHSKGLDRPFRDFKRQGEVPVSGMVVVRGQEQPSAKVTAPRSVHGQRELGPGASQRKRSSESL